MTVRNNIPVFCKNLLTNLKIMIILFYNNIYKQDLTGRSIVKNLIIAVAPYFILKGVAAMAKTGRKSIYDTDIAPHLKEIKKAVKNGATVTEVANALGIAESTLYKYKNEKAELSAAFAHGRANIVIEVRGALLKKALGYNYTEEKKLARKTQEGETIVFIEKHKKHVPPSETAAAMLLRNYDKTWIDKDSTTTKLKQDELELRKALADNNNFNLE